jgi:SAM-dependent methyltransferase
MRGPSVAAELDPQASPGGATGPGHAAGELFLVSWLVLFLELACIRWFPAHVLFLTFFTNVVLLACFVGMSVGCLAAGHRRDYLRWAPLVLALGLLAGLGVEPLRTRLRVGVDVRQASAQMVYFGAERGGPGDIGDFLLPVEVVAGFFFLVVALALVGPGQELGRAMARLPNRVQAYTINIAGGVAGIALFALFSWLQLSPAWWFAAVALALGYLLARRRRLALGAQVPLLLLVFAASGYYSGDRTALTGRLHFWSPYYRVDYNPNEQHIAVNLIGHQEMSSRQSTGPEYALPHLLNRDSGRRPFGDVLIIGAGSGNDVSRALGAGARHVDAVEIDPVLRRLGDDHPDRPYADPRVTTHLDDGRNFLRRAADRQYDLIVYALVDSLVLHSSYSNIRLESYLFTEQAFRDVRRCLRPGGQFVMSNFFRQGWLVGRCRRMLTDVFGQPPLVLPLPYEPVIGPQTDLDRFTIFLSGDTEALKKAFEANGEYWLPSDQSPLQVQANGFHNRPGPRDNKADWHRFGLAKVQLPAEELRPARDDWPFLYLRQPTIPDLSLRGMGLMAALALLLLYLFRPRAEAAPAENGGAGERWRLAGRLFFLGAGFMLVETKAVVHMALLFGSTWMVNSLVFFAVLLMILAANLFVLRFRPRRLEVFYAGLVLALALNAAVPMGSFLGMSRAVQVLGSCLLVFAPIGFAAVIFAVSFARSAAPDQAFGANVAGALLGGLAEYTSMVLGFQYLILVALAFYLLAIALRLPAPAGRLALDERPAGG